MRSTTICLRNARRTAQLIMYNTGIAPVRRGMHGLWALHHRSTGRFVGYCGVARGEDTGEPELMYALLPAWWGQGLGTEAAAAVVELADRSLPELLATADPANVASLRILARLGFTVTHTAADVHGLPTVFLRRIRQDTDCSVDTA